MIRLPNGVVIVALLLSACSSAGAPRASQEPAAISQYKGWTVSVTPAQIDANLWRARVLVWPPEVRPGTHPGISLNFSQTAGDRRSVEAAGNAAARHYIDSSQVEHVAPR
jgi:hypothetical protein